MQFQFYARFPFRGLPNKAFPTNRKKNNRCFMRVSLLNPYMYISIYIYIYACMYIHIHMYNRLHLTLCVCVLAYVQLAHTEV